ncbi:MAG: response regulator [Dehalococcoidales bacterium]|nr:response regulator [Dehalococcoidales bacterium]
MKASESILVVDDDLDFLKIISRILGSKDYEVGTAPSAGKAISRLKERFYNAAILDISLPDANGTELLSRIIEIHPDIIAIMLTGHSSVQNAVESLNRGAFAYLEKPLDPENLLSVISRGIERQRLVMENRDLVEELERHNRITDTLLNVSQAVSQSLDLQEIIDAALDKVTHSTGLEANFIYLNENEQLLLKGHHGFSRRIFQAMPKELGKDSGVIGRIFGEAKSEIIEDLANYTESDLEFLLNGGYHSFAGVPLTILGESIGVLGVATSFANYFSANNIELLTGIGREIAIAVRNAQLYEEASSAKALRELDSMRTEFLANVSHELRTPLAVIKGSANSLLQSDVIFDEQTRRDFLSSIDKDADTLTRLVDDLLMMSRLEAEALEVRIKPHKPAEVIDSIKDRLDKLTAKHHLHIDIPETTPPVAIDNGRIGEVLTNLVENAVKFSEDNTTISIEAHPNGKEVILSVVDEGVGIPPELHHKIFERFFQRDGRKTGRRKGTGLGLAICRGIVEAHGGRIWMESEPSKGTRFSFSLPVD